MELVLDYDQRPDTSWQAARALAVHVQRELTAAGFDCDGVCAIDDEWGFLIEPHRSPDGVAIECRFDAHGPSASWRLCVIDGRDTSERLRFDGRRSTGQLLDDLDALLRRAPASTLEDRRN
jgi:hypothetical protein